jgi:DNA-binding MarR family transcriptional regulator
MQTPREPTTDPAAAVEQAIKAALPDGRGFDAWRAFLRAHATLMRKLATDLALKSDLPLGDFDVLAQLARAGGELRMTDLATKVFSSRSAMTRRVDRMIDEELVRRARSEADGREVVIALTPAGLTRLIEAVPVHLAGVSALFIERLDDDELAVLESALNRVSTDCSFG